MAPNTQTTTEAELPLALGANPNVEAFADVDGTAFVFAAMPADQPVREQLDEIFADTRHEFRTARHAATVDGKVDLNRADIDRDHFDMLFIYE